MRFFVTAVMAGLLFATNPAIGAPAPQRTITVTAPQTASAARITHERCPLKRGHRKEAAAAKCAAKVGATSIRLPNGEVIKIVKK